MKPIRSAPRIAILFVAAVAPRATSQAQDSTITRLPTVHVEVTRQRGQSPFDSPFSVTTARPDSARPGQRHSSLDESLLGIPGLTVANRNNPTQDPRISIRGFGARSAFGVRGILVMRDGIPLTLADGQTPVDYLDLESIGSIEVIRGTAAALYGNASGGVIDIRTASAAPQPVEIHARYLAGSYGLQKLLGAASGTLHGFRYQADASHTESDGFRAYSHSRSTNAFARTEFGARGTDIGVQATIYDLPSGENPGALTAEQFAENPRLADPLSIRKRAGKSVHQVQLGASATRPLTDGELTATMFGGTRSLENPLTFAVVHVDRTSWGASARATLPARLIGISHRVSVGADYREQRDDRTNNNNCADTLPVVVPTADCPVPNAQRGALTLDQTEIISNLGPYARDEIILGSRVRATVGVRWDNVRFAVHDHLITADDPDDSGDRTLHALSPMAGLVLRATPLTAIYANVASAFETPTTTELANQPNGSAGINRDLQPQFATTYELGVKGYLFSRVRYDGSVYEANVRDELIPSELPSGRSFYRNAGRGRHRGAELALEGGVGPISLMVAYSYAHLRFTSFTVDTNDYSGNSIPGVPDHQLQAAATLRWQGMFGTVEGIMASDAFVDDPNSAKAPGYGVMNLRLGGTLPIGASRFTPIIGITNVFDRRYVSSVAVNAARGKYFEPGTGRAIYVGLTAGASR